MAREDGRQGALRPRDLEQEIRKLKTVRNGERQKCHHVRQPQEPESKHAQWRSCRCLPAGMKRSSTPFLPRTLSNELQKYRTEYQNGGRNQKNKSLQNAERKSKREPSQR